MFLKSPIPKECQECDFLSHWGVSPGRDPVIISCRSLREGKTPLRLVAIYSFQANKGWLRILDRARPIRLILFHWIKTIDDLFFIPGMLQIDTRQTWHLHWGWPSRAFSSLLSTRSSWLVSYTAILYQSTTWQETIRFSKLDEHLSGYLVESYSRAPKERYQPMVEVRDKLSDKSTHSRSQKLVVKVRCLHY